MERLLAFMLCAVSLGVGAQTTVTLSVDMSNETVSPEGVHVAGSFQGWDPSATPMIDNGDGTWSYMFTTDTLATYQYLFINGNDWGSHEAIPGACAFDGNRQITVDGMMGETSSIVCFNSCGACGMTTVRFRVDMSNEDVSPFGVHVAGDFQGWDPAGTEMTDADGDMVYEYVHTFEPEVTLVKYKFINGSSWTDPNESLFGDCTDNTGLRILDLGNEPDVLLSANSIGDAYCFNQCSSCVLPLQVTFTVDMSVVSSVSDQGVHIAGTFQGWDAESTMLTDNGDGTWSTTLEVAPGVHEFKFINGAGWNGGEENMNGTSCNAGGNRGAIFDDENDDYEACFETCPGELCLPDPPPAFITFQVDATEEDLVGESLFIFGAFTGWQGGAIEMTDNGDGTWQTTQLVSGSANVDYKYSIGFPSDQGNEESGSYVLVGDSTTFEMGGCGVANGFGGWNRRFLRSGVDETVPLHCFNSCSICSGLGCTIPDACNYEAFAAIEDGSCLFAGDECDDGVEYTAFDSFNSACECQGIIQSVFDIISNSSEHELFTEALLLSGLKDDLDGPEEYTVLAPSDSAITAFLSLNGVNETQFLTAFNLREVLESNIIEGIFPYEYIAFEPDSILTISGQSLSCVSSVYPSCELEISSPNITGENGLVHFANALLWSPDSFDGCTISVACNYNPFAINDDNSCEFICPGCTDPTACNFVVGALQDDGTCTYPEDSGWCNCEGAVVDALGICGGTCDFDQDNDGVCDDVDDCIGIVDACGICNGPGAIYPCGCDDYPEGSCSCDGLTLVDQCGVCDGDGTSCVGCMYDFACTYDPEATIQDVSLCEFGTCGGCLDPLACNYNPTVNGDDGSCEYPAVYLDCEGNCLNDANGNGVCDENEIFGCAYPYACNFDPQVTVDDGSCDYSCVESFCEADYDFGNASWGFSPNPNIGESFAVGTVNVPYSDVLQVLLPTTWNEIDLWGSEEIPLDSVWFDSDFDANGILTDVVFTDVESNENFMSEDIGFVLRIDNPGTGEGYTHLGTPGGQTCISIFGVPQRASTFQVSLVLVTYFTYYGESYVFQYPYNFSMSVVTASIGCMDPDACNYQPTAVEDDGSCGVFDECGVCAGLGIPEGECDCDGNVVDAVGVCGGDCSSDFNANGICDSDEVFGCTYDSAENYDPEATSDDGTCVGFEGANVSSCLFDGDGNGGVGSGDLLGLLSEFGNVCD